MTEPRPRRPRRPNLRARGANATPNGKANGRPNGDGVPPQAPDEQSALDVLRNRPFLFLWLAQLSTQVSGYMVLYGLTIILTSAYSSNTANGALLLSFLVPSVIFSAIAGVYVDRLDRRLVLVVTNILRGLAYLGIVFVGANLLPLYLLVIFVATTTTFFGPAEASMIPILVRREHLLPANGLFTLTMNASFAVGFALFGPLVVSVSSPAILIAVVAALYFVAAALCWTLPPAPPESEGVSGGLAVAEAERAVESMFSQLREGLEYIRRNPAISWSMAYLGVSASLVGVLGALGPKFATQTLGLGEKDFVVVALPLGFGVVAGILALNSYGRYVPRRRMIEAGLIALGALVGLLAIAGPISAFLVGSAQRTGLQDVGRIVSLLGIVIAIGFLAGVAYIAVAVSAQTQLQEDLREDARGRVFGILNMLVSIASFLPIIVVAPLADLIGNSPVIFMVAMFILLTGVASVILRRPGQAGGRLPMMTVPAAHAPVDPLTVAAAPAERAPRHGDAQAGDQGIHRLAALPMDKTVVVAPPSAHPVVEEPTGPARDAGPRNPTPMDAVPQSGAPASVAPPDRPPDPLPGREASLTPPAQTPTLPGQETSSAPESGRPRTSRWNVLHRGGGAGRPTPRPRGIIRRSILDADRAPSLADRLRRIRENLPGGRRGQQRP